MKRIFILTSAIFIALSAFSSVKIGDLFYELDEKNLTATVTYENDDDDTRYTYLPSELIIPGKVDYEDKSYMVTTIGTSAFRGCKDISTIQLPENLKQIGGYAFYGCSQLASINIPDGVTSIGQSCFENCTLLTELKLPSGVNEFGNSAFYGCSQLASINIPEGITKIPEHCFHGCSSLTELMLPSGVTEIGDWAFYGCSQLASINIPEGVKAISNWCFYNCSSLTELKLPAGVTEIFYAAFRECRQLASINIPSGVTKIPNYCFYNCSSLAELKLPAGVAEIGSYAFQNCSQLSSINIPDGVTQIPHWCFYNCSSLTELKLPAGVTEIGERAFYGCNQLTSINIPDGVLTIPQGCFYNCSSLNELKLPLGVTEISSVAFYGCNQLTSINIPDGVTKIPNSCFYKCSSLTELKLPEGVNEFGTSAFYYCSKLASINIPDGVTKIPSSCFEGCSSLTDLTLPSGVREIDSYAFLSCGQLEQLTSLNPIPPISKSFPFYLKTVYVPFGAKAAYEAADGWQNYNIVELPGELEGTLKVEDFVINGGGTAESTLSFVGELRANRYSGFQFFMNLPEGISVTELQLSESLASAGYRLSQNDLSQSPVEVRVVVANTTANMGTEETANLLTITFKAADNAPDGEAQINLSNLFFSSTLGDDIPMTDSQTIVTINNVPVESFEISPKQEESIFVGQECTFTATVKPANATNQKFEWSLDVVDGEEPVVEIVTNENGEITVRGLRLGTATLTVTAADYMGATAKATVNVVATPAQSISIDGGGVKSIKQTETLELTAKVLPENTTYPEVTWESSDSGIATVSQEGVVTGVEPGQVTITAYVTAQPNVKATYDITVGKLLLGDSNDNGIVTVADVVTTANYLIDEPIVDWCFVNADVIGDNKITPADVTATVDIIINDTDYMSRRSARAVGTTNGVDRLVADNFRNGQNEARIEVKLDNSMAYSALMATVAIPQGMQIKEVVKGPRAADHVLMYNINDAGDLKIVLFSYTNATFGEGGDALFTIVASTEGVTDNIEMFNIIASDASSTDYDLGFDGGLNESQATGIDVTEGSDIIIILAVAEGIEVLNAEGQQIGIYSLEGANMASKLALSGREKFELMPGIYVVIAGKTTAKVLVK